MCCTWMAKRAQNMYEKCVKHNVFSGERAVLPKASSFFRISFFVSRISGCFWWFLCVSVSSRTPSLNGQHLMHLFDLNISTCFIISKCARLVIINHKCFVSMRVRESTDTTWIFVSCITLFYAANPLSVLTTHWTLFVRELLKTFGKWNGHKYRDHTLHSIKCQTVNNYNPIVFVFFFFSFFTLFEPRICNKICAVSALSEINVT